MLDFIVNNYLIIVIVATFLIFALIGFAIDSTKNRKAREAELLNTPNDDGNIAKLQQNIEMAQAIEDNNLQTKSNENISTLKEEDSAIESLNLNTDNE